ncbi:MAG: hypothetical protein ABIQ05_08270 [Candidatus Limnocylindria bacterium]
MRDEQGAVLLEVLVALAILATAGTTLVSMVTEQVRAVATVREREDEYRAADGVLSRLALRDRQGLDIRIGRREEGSFVTDVQRPRPGLYRLSVRAAAAPELELCVTVVYRAGES